MKRFILLVPAALLALAVAATTTSATTYDIKLGAGYAAASLFTPSTAQADIGSGSWYKLGVSPKAEVYIKVAPTFGTTFTVDQIASITYRTVNNATNPSGVDFYAVLYTAPYAGGIGGLGGWYGQRLIGEPYLTNNYVPPTAMVWNTWATAAGPNQLTFNDSNHSGNQGFYNAPTLADLQAGAIDWSAWPTNPTGGSASGGAIDYGSQPVDQISFQTGTGWTSFEGWLDDVTVTLTNGDVYVLDFEPATDPLYVDGTWAGSGVGSEIAPGRWYGYNAFATVQDAVNAAIPGGTIHVAAGTYTEQVVVDGKDVDLQGAGSGSTILKSPASLPAFFTTSGDNHPVLLFENSADIRLSGVTVDGDGQGNANYRFMGVAFWNAGGKLLDCDVVRVRDTPWSGAQHGNAVYAYNNTGGPYAIEVGNCNVSDFQKNGITMNGTGLTANVHDCTVTGNGYTTITAQNGIQVAFGAGGSVSDNSISDIGYTGTNNAVACGLLFYDVAGGPGGPITVTGGSVTNCQFGCYFDNINGGASNLAIATDFVQGVGAGTYPAFGYGVYNETTSAPNLSGSAAHPHASPFEEATGAFSRTGPLSSSSVVSVSLTGGCVTGSDQPASEGLELWSAGGPLAVTATGLEVSHWDTGILADGPGLSVDANHNAITANVTAGYDGSATPTNLAAFNWWGDAGGPGAGGANPVVGATVTYAPWLITGADANPGCGFVAAADNAVTPGPAPSCISAANTCITVPVDIARTTSDGLRGFSVTLQLSSNLMLCSGTSSIVEGNYLSDVSGTTFQVVDNGGGSYTVDGAILGLPCGATAPTGTLFTLDLAKVAGPDGTGTVTVGTVLLRDCDNAAVVASAGAPLSITIDTGGPTAIANLGASQKKTGNDADGTTAIQLSFTAPGDAATVEVYRAPYGQYPEYDDAGGAPPSAPSYPPAAPWALTGVTASGQYDEVATRDFWYFVAFTKDACGNVSAVSNMTTGTLNYHLGDVTDGITPGTGNNLVNTVDISLLGSHYGINLTPGDPYNYLDVGPTTDYSVNARPTTDNHVGFEDLMMFAINYGQVSAPANRPLPVAAGMNALGLGEVPAAGVGETFTVPVTMSGAGNVQGASLAFSFDARVVEFVSAEAGPLLGSQGHESVVLSPGAGTVDFALLGEGAGISGDGSVVNVTFRRTAAGDPAIALAGITARDGANHPVSFTGVQPQVPATTMLGSPYPNPFRGSTSLRLALSREGKAKVAVYDLVGRRIRTLVDGVQPAGERTISWDGRDDGGRSVPAGLYLLRFEANGVEQSRRLILMQ